MSRPSTRSGPHSTIRFRTTLSNTVYDVMCARGWKETESDTDWDINWADIGWMREFFDHIHLDEHQKVNHFRNHYELTRKDLLIKNLKRAKKTLEREERHAEAAAYNFFPTTYNLPMEYGMFVEEFKKHPGQWWIMKPIGRAQGKGIFLFNKLSAISEWKNHRWRGEGQTAESYVVQRYLEVPYLIGGKKFDLRLYVLVTSYSPLTVWIFRDGFARFSHHRFTMSLREMDNAYIHLTNAAIQKTSEKHDKISGSKWPLRSLKLYLISKHGMEAVNQLFQEIQSSLLLSLLAVQKVMINDKHCFELYGYDTLIDENLKPWLLEVNASPSLTSDTEEDRRLKGGLIHDALDVVDVEMQHKGEERLHVGGFDLLYRNGYVQTDKNQLLSSYLGCFVERQKSIPRAGRSKERQAELEKRRDRIRSRSGSRERASAV